MNRQHHLTVRTLLFAIWLLTHNGFASASSVTYYWPQTPLDIDLTVGAERHISIPDADELHLGIPREIRHRLQTEIIGNNLWLKAKEAISSTRLILLAEPVGRLILQIRADHSKHFNQPIVIQEDLAVQKSVEESHSFGYGYVTLTRWVVQQLYAPPRLLRELTGVQRLAVDSTPIEIFRCAMRVPTPCAGALATTPIASWQSPQLFVTAVKITNTLSQPIVLDPRELRGQWRSAAFVHNMLHASGHHGDTTVLVLISDFPFEISQL